MYDAEPDERFVPVWKISLRGQCPPRVFRA